MHMLAAIDLGGTHCRFARFAATPRGLDLEAVETCPTAGLQDSDTVLQQWESCLHTPLSRVAALVIGVAGPVQDGLRARLSNAPLRIDLNAVMPQFGLRRARVVNDFVCEACACLTRVGERSLHLLGPADIPCPSHRSPGEAPAPVAVLGAGTGLGSGCAGRPCRQSPGIRPLPFWGGKKRTSRSLPVNGWDGHCCVLMMWSRGAVWPCCTTF